MDGLPANGNFNTYRCPRDLAEHFEGIGVAQWGNPETGGRRGEQEVGRGAEGFVKIVMSSGLVPPA